MVLGSVVITGQTYNPSPGPIIVYKSTDIGTSWQKMTLTANEGIAYALAVHPTNKNILLAGGFERTAGVEQYALFKTTDAGSHWVRMGLSGNGNVRAVAHDPKNTNRIYLGSSNGVLTSTDGGTTWQNSLQYVWVTCLTVDPVVADRAYIGTSNGVYTTTNGGSTWFTMNNGLTIQSIDCMAYDASHNTLYAGTNGGGLFRLSSASGVDDEGSVSQPGTVVLHQNYPNPFNASTEIRYRLKKTERVRLSVFNLRGGMIRVIVDGIQSSGMNRVVWDGKDGSGRGVPSGIYFYRLETEYGSTVRKLVMQK